MNEEKINQILKNQQTIISTLSVMDVSGICKKNLEDSYDETQTLLNPKDQKEPMSEELDETMGGRFGEEPTMNPDEKEVFVKDSDLIDVAKKIKKYKDALNVEVEEFKPCGKILEQYKSGLYHCNKTCLCSECQIKHDANHAKADGVKE